MFFFSFKANLLLLPFLFLLPPFCPCSERLHSDPEKVQVPILQFLCYASVHP